MTLDDLIELATELRKLNPEAGKAAVHFLTESSELGDAVSRFNLLTREGCESERDTIGLAVLEELEADAVVTLG